MPRVSVTTRRASSPRTDDDVDGVRKYPLARHHLSDAPGRDESLDRRCAVSPRVGNPLSVIDEGDASRTEGDVVTDSLYID